MTGFPCPKCGDRLDTKDTRFTHHAGRASVRRRRQCRKCKKRFTSYEVLEGRYERANAAAVLNMVRKLHHATGGLIEELDLVSAGPEVGL